MNIVKHFRERGFPKSLAKSAEAGVKARGQMTMRNKSILGEIENALGEQWVRDHASGGKKK